MIGQQVDLSQVLQIAASALAQDRDNLNHAEAYNRDHGDNVVNAFQTITMAMAEKPAAPQSMQLSCASQELTQQRLGSVLRAGTGGGLAASASAARRRQTGRQRHRTG